MSEIEESMIKKASCQWPYGISVHGEIRRIRINNDTTGTAFFGTLSFVAPEDTAVPHQSNLSSKTDVLLKQFISLQ